MPDRQAGRRGLAPQRQEGHRYAIRWAHQYLMAATAPAYPIDVSAGITDWGMLGNDQEGDCVPAAVAHERMLAHGAPTTAEVLSIYHAYTGGQDTGVVIADFLLWLFQQGWIDGFAPVEPSWVDTIMAQFNRGILLGVSLTDDAEDLFNRGEPWTVAQGERPDPDLGHGILKVKSVAEGGDGTVVTWGADQEVTGGWDAACIDEAWIVLTKDDESMVDFNSLDADLRQLPQVTVAPAPVTPPAPAPAPVPVPDPQPTPPPAPPVDINGFIAQIKEIVAAAKAELEAVEHDLDHAAHGIFRSAEHAIEELAEQFLAILGYPTK